MSTSSQLSFAIQLHELDWQDFSATMATLPSLPGRKPEVLADFDSYALAELLLQPENIISRLQQLDLVGLLILHWLTAAGSKGLSPQEVDNKLSDTIPWISAEERELALKNIRHSALVGIQNNGNYSCWTEVVHARAEDSTSNALDELLLLQLLTEKDPVPEVTITETVPERFGSGYDFLAALRELMRLLQLRPTKLRIDGLPVKSELDRIEPLLPVAIKDLVRPTIALLGQTRLTNTSDSQMVLTELAEEFIRQEPAVEWSRLAAHWLSLFPEIFQQTLAARTPLSIPELWRILYPWQDTDIDRFSVTIEELAEIGAAIGFVKDGFPTELLYRFSALSAENRILVPDTLVSQNEALEAAESKPTGSKPADSQQTNSGQTGPNNSLLKTYPVIGAHLESFVLPGAKLYLQNDLSAVATGPLTHADDAGLSKFTNKESVGFAPSYRFSNESLYRAWRLGSTPDALRALLGRLAKNDAPLALEYLIDDTFQNAQKILVSAGFRENESGTFITLKEDFTSELMLRDPKLSPLRLQPFEGKLFTSQPLDPVADVLSLSNHHCIIIRDEKRQRSVAEGDEISEPTEVFTGSVAVVRELWTRIQSEPVPDAKGQVLSSLEKRGSSHPPYWFTIVLQDESEQRLQLQPLGLAGGRLRVRDIVAETERTIPLRRVKKIEEIHESEILGK